MPVAGKMSVDAQMAEGLAGGAEGLHGGVEGLEGGAEGLHGVAEGLDGGAEGLHGVVEGLEGGADVEPSTQLKGGLEVGRRRGCPVPASC